jgi:hypothetical protein
MITLLKVPTVINYPWQRVFSYIMVDVIYELCFHFKT